MASVTGDHRLAQDIHRHRAAVRAGQPGKVAHGRHREGNQDDGEEYSVHGRGSPAGSANRAATCNAPRFRAQ